MRRKQGSKGIWGRKRRAKGKRELLGGKMRN